MSTPELHLRTLFHLDGGGRIVGTREPGSVRGPVLKLVRGRQGCAWAVRAGLPRCLANELNRLAAAEPPVDDLSVPPVSAARFVALTGGEIDAGPAFGFPQAIAEADGVVFVNDVDRLTPHLPGWHRDEVSPRSPIAAIEIDGFAVSACCCARRTAEAAEAGLETAPAFRGKGFAARVTAAWALAVRATGRVPLYSTSWSNAASLAVAARLGLVGYASGWGVNDAHSSEPL